LSLGVVFPRSRLRPSTNSSTRPRSHNPHADCRSVPVNTAFPLFFSSDLVFCVLFFCCFRFWFLLICFGYRFLWFVYGGSLGVSWGCCVLCFALWCFLCVLRFGFFCFFLFDPRVFHSFFWFGAVLGVFFVGGVCCVGSLVVGALRIFCYFLFYRLCLLCGILAASLLPVWFTATPPRESGAPPSTFFPPDPFVLHLDFRC